MLVCYATTACDRKTQSRAFCSYLDELLTPQTREVVDIMVSAVDSTTDFLALGLLVVVVVAMTLTQLQLDTLLVLILC